MKLQPCFNDGYYPSNPVTLPNGEKGREQRERFASSLVIARTREEKILAMTGRGIFLLAFFILSFSHSFISSAQTFTSITLPYSGTCVLQPDRSAYFKVTINTATHLHFKVDKFVNGITTYNVEYTLSRDPAMTDKVIEGRMYYTSESVVTLPLLAGTYYLKLTTQRELPPFSWSMEAIVPANTKEMDYTASLPLGRTTGKMSRDGATIISEPDEDDGDPSVDKDGGMYVALGKGFTFKAEGGKVYKII